MINRALGRESEEDTSSSNEQGETYYIDVPKEHWGYDEVINASGK